MAYEKQEVKAGDIMTPDWGNHVQKQYEEALPKYGSNSNGQYYRWDNGLQICWGDKTDLTPNWISIQSGKLYYSSLPNIVFPEPFSEPPKIFVTLKEPRVSSRSAWHTNSNATTTESTLFIASLINDNSGMNLNWFAIGRWK